MTIEKENSSGAVEKAIDVLEVFLKASGAPLKVAAVCEATGLKRNAVDRNLQLWEARGWLKRNERNEWTLGAKLLRFSESYADFCLHAISAKS